MPARYAVIIPACNEAACLGAVLRELRAELAAADFVIVVGVNASTDATAEIAREQGALVAETAQRGYGYGCQAAIDLVKESCPEVEAYLFVAGDGANHPADVASLVRAYEGGCDFVLGSRTNVAANWPVMSLQHVLANCLLAAWCGVLTGRFFRDIGPLRLIERQLFEAMQLREFTFGWTIEAQILAVQLGAGISEIPVRERHRLAGEQKVSRVSWRRSARIGLKIFAAGWRTWRRGPSRSSRAALSAAREAYLVKS